MQLEALFEKREKALYQLYHYLSQQEDKWLPLKMVSQDLALSKSTLQRYITSFQEEAYLLGLDFVIADEKVSYQRKPHLSSQELHQFFLQNSVKYQILLLLYQEEVFSIPYLAQELMVSEATLNRHLAGLNVFLEEFGLTIRKGRLRGSELQIRYFYFQLFWQTYPLDLLDSQLFPPYFHQKVGIFERLYDSRFNKRQRYQLLLWLVITSKRLRYKHLDYEELHQLLLPYLPYKFYQTLRQVTFTLFEQLSGELHEGDVMCLFAFLFSQFILEAQQVEQMLAFGGPIMEATTLGLSHIHGAAPSQLREEAMYHLNQLLSQRYFFRGYLLTAPLTTTLMEWKAEADALLQEVSTQVQGFQTPVSDDFLAYLTDEISALMRYLTEETPPVFRIGLSLCQSPIRALPLLHQLRQELGGHHELSLEFYQEGRDYDLILSDLEQVGAKTYLLSLPLKSGELVSIKEQITKIRQTWTK